MKPWRFKIRVSQFVPALKYRVLSRKRYLKRLRQARHSANRSVDFVPPEGFTNSSFTELCNIMAKQVGLPFRICCPKCGGVWELPEDQFRETGILALPLHRTNSSPAESWSDLDICEMSEQLVKY